MSDEQAEAAAAEADESADAESETEQDDAGGLQGGDFVKLDYTLRTTEDDDVVDTTILEVAEEAGIDTEEHEFSPRTIIIGEGHVFESVDDALIGSEVGDEGSVVISAEEAFGEYDPDQVKTISAQKIDEDDRYPGANVQIDGQNGHIETIIGGRARVNFNHPLAGQELEYEYEILEEVEDRAEKAEGLLGMYLQHSPPVWIETDEVEEEVPVDSDDDEDAEPEFETQTVEKETLYIESTPQLTMNQQWMMSKGQIAQDIIEKIGIDRVIVQEILDGSGMGGMFGGMGGMGGLGGAEDVEEALDDVDLDDVDLDADELAEEIEDEA
jgi:FKBP-type peptidyl-prolyl cis-trans isomerase SlyD